MCKISLHKFLSIWRVVLLVFAFALGGSRVQVAHAASLSVNTTDDNITSGDGFCTLREAITNANSDSDTTSGDCAAGTGADSITFSISGTITLMVGPLPAIDDPAGLTIDGAAQSITISGNLLNRVMRVASGAALMVQNLTIANGAVEGTGAGIANNGTLTVTNSIITGNNSAFGGGAIINSGALIVTNSTFSANISSSGGGIFNLGTMTITGSTFSFNSAGTGGGISNSGTLTVTNSTFSGNNALAEGGGIDNNGTLIMTNNTFSSNSAVVEGGGIDNDAMLTITNSTFFGNSAVFGGGIANTGSVLLRNTIVADSPYANCFGIGFIDGGGNLTYPIHPDNSCPGINADPLLDSLQVNPPGDTATHALLPGSPAIDTAVLANCPATDQRGVARPRGAGCDIGAFESVIYNFSGFFPPVDNPPTFNVVRAGARVPVKFSLSGNQGLNIFAVGYPTSAPIACPLSASLDATEQTLIPEDGSLSYDATTDTYNYKWRTDSAWAGTCRQLTLRLIDGTEHSAYFMFR